MFLFPFFPKHHKSKQYKINDPRRFLGHTGIVTIAINHYRPGQIKIQGQYFRAAAPGSYQTITPPSVVMVIGIHSDNLNTLVVEAVEIRIEEDDNDHHTPYGGLMEAPA